MNLFQVIKSYNTGWTEVETQQGFNAEETALIEKAEVVASSFGSSLKLTCSDKKLRFIPMDEFTTYQIGDVVNPSEIVLVTLTNGTDTIYRAR